MPTLKTPKSPDAPSTESGADRHLCTDHVKVDIKHRSVRGGAIAFSAQGVKFALGLASTALLARLLSPRDFGVVAVVTAVTGFVALFRDFGLGAVTIQRKEIQDTEVSALFWINAATGLVLVGITAALAPALAAFYQKPELRDVTFALSGVFLLGGLGVQHQALLRRQMRFLALAAIDIGALAAGLTVGVMAARGGAGYWALVYMHLTIEATFLILTWTLCRWRPRRPGGFGAVRSMLGFGANLTGYNLLNYVARNLDKVLIGRVFGMVAAGLYDHAYRLLMLPLRQINGPATSVAIPALSRLADEPDRYREAYFRFLDKIVLVTLPGVVFMIATSDWLVGLVLGPQWGGAATVFLVLGLTAIVQPINHTAGWLFITQNRSREQLRWGLISMALIVGSILAGLPFGVLGVAAAYAGSSCLICTPLLWWYIGRRGPVTASGLWRTVAPFAFAAVVTLAILVLFRFRFDASPLAGLAIAFSLTVIVDLGVLACFARGRAALADTWNSIATLRRRGRA
ncbi:MAG: lipopolysaccharide biosynthesis protein [Planctomycetota bacterium]